MRLSASLLASLTLGALGLVGWGCNGSNNASSGELAASAAPSASPATSGSAAASASNAAKRAAPTREGGSIARAATDDALYVADEDHGVIRKIALPFDPAAPVITVEMPGLPAQVLALDDRVLVSIRSEGGAPPKAQTEAEKSAKKSRIPAAPTGAGLLLIMKHDAAAGLVEVARVKLPADAWGIAITPDEKTALVSSAWTHQISAVDIAGAKKLWSLDVPREPRAIVVRPDGASAYVTHLVGGVTTRLDGILGQPTARALTFPPSPLRTPSNKTLDGTLAYSAVLSPDGNRLYVPRHAIGALGEASWFGAATVDVLLTADDTPLAPKREPTAPRADAEIAGQMNAAINESKGNIPRVSYTPFSAPRAVAYKKSTNTILVASEGTNRVVELDARVVDPTMFVKGAYQVGADRDKLIPVSTTCGAPSGLALSADESSMWVFCRSTSDVVEVSIAPKKAEKKPETKADPKAYPFPRVRIAEELLDENDGRGRRMFYDATDSITSGGMSCASCHPEGRDDGHVWHEAKITTRSGEAVNFLGDGDQAPRDLTQSVGYPRQTPMLAGRVSAAGPYGWHAESADLVARLKAGFGLHRWGTQSLTYGDGELLGRAQYLAPFLRHGLVPPPRDAHELTAQEAKGKEIFMSERSRCSKCHAPETEYTDRTAYPFSPPLLQMTGFEREREENFKTPSLYFVAGTAPYFHDGRYATLEGLIEQNNDRMGRTSHLTADDRAALIAFLRTL